MSEPITAVIVGAGHRALLYASYAELQPKELKIVGVAEPNKNRRDHVASKFNLSTDRCFKNATELAQKGSYCGCCY